MLSLSGVDESNAVPDDARAEAPPSDRSTPAPSRIDPRKIVPELNKYRAAQPGRSFFELFITIVPFVALCALMLVAVERGHLAALLLTVPAGLFLLRLFLIQHDCGHGAFFPSRSANDWLGRTLGVLTFTPYDCWRRSHAQHHATTGNLDARGFGDIDTLTVREFRARTGRGKLLYRLYRNPLVLFGLGPAYQFLVRHRLPMGLRTGGKEYWFSAMGTNVAIAALLVVLAQLFGIGVVALVLLPVVLTAASFGLWLFYIQHQFEDAHWDDEGSWSFHDAALHGSSHLDLPPVLRWFTANIGIHHVHHLASRIPFYRLPAVLRAHPELASVNRLTARQAMATLRLALWDESTRRMVRFASA